MLKIIGICCILGGALCGIGTWNAGKKEKIRLIEEIIDFLRQAETAVEHQTPIIDFLQSFVCAGQEKDIGRKQEEPFREALTELVNELEKNEWGLGSEAWKSVLERNWDKWDFNEEQWETVCQIGQIAGGRSRNAILETIAQLKRRFLEMERTEQNRLSEQRKVVMPVGMLAGVMLVLLFL